MTGLVLGLVVTGLLMSLVGSFAPVFAAEAYVVGVALAQPPPVALAVAGAVVVGQALGKAAVLASVRAAPRWPWVRGARAAAEHGRRGSGAWGVALAARTAAWTGPVRRWTTEAMGRPSAPFVVVLSGAVGLPPLLAVTLCAGPSRMRLGSFVAACVAGRGVRMGALAVAPGALAGAAWLPW
ncbi:hypothetical protein [Cellulomonas iranensis]|uniref:hypothetical protein n=1 Tax=Cellulomonas iranensis TaxID=76862 RepID=UPI000B3CF0BF|nr:hypothetical protein [Cellulomonas iranensis]